jgi:Na+/phosphate symporter
MENQNETVIEEIKLDTEMVEQIQESIDNINISKYDLTEAEKYDVDKILEENSKLTALIKCISSIT